MAEYDNYGPLDSRFIPDGDTFFQGINARQRPDQLKPGFVAYAQNARMDVDGALQVRKGIDNWGGTIGSTNETLTLPCYLYKSETIAAASRVNETVTIELADFAATLLDAATTGTHYLRRTVDVVVDNWYVYSIFAKPNGRGFINLEIEMANGAVRYGINLSDGTLGVAAGSVINFSRTAIDAVADDNGYYRCFLAFRATATETVTITSYISTSIFSAGRNYAGNTSLGLFIWGAQVELGTMAQAKGRRYEPTAGSVGSINMLTYSEDFTNAAWTASDATPTDDATEGPSPFVDNTIVCIEGLTGTVNANGNRRITVVSGGEFTFDIPGSTGSETYTLSTATAGAPRLEANTNAVYGSCRFSDPSDDNAEYIIEATYGKAVAISLDDGSSTDIAYPAGVSISAPVEMIQAFNKVFIFRDGLTAIEWNGSFSGTPAFAKVANGSYAANVYLNSASNTVIADGIVTVSENAHGLSVGDKIYVVDAGSSSLTVDSGGYFIATVPTANSFTFYAEVKDMSAHSVVYTRKVSNGRGFTHMPAPAWGVYHQRRLIVPFAYTTTGSSGSEVITARNVRDELLFSDIFDSDTYDQLVNQFKVTAGIADYLQWVHPFTDDHAIAFNRNSIHLITGISGSLQDIEIDEITREAGLVARHSVVTIGSNVFFLSDNGVYATSFGDLYNLRGAGLPLSEAIDPIIKRINKAYAKNSVAIFHDNRYWIAVPLDSSVRNNALLVYNLLNQAWESVDIINDPNWDISNLIVGGAGQVNKLYAVNRFGGLHILDARDDDVDRVSLYPGIGAESRPISATFTTRQYALGTMERKKFNSFEIQVESSESNDSDATISIQTENIDSESTLGTLSDYLGGDLASGEDASIRGRMGNVRGYGVQITFTPTQGRPKLRMTKINAIPAFRSTTQAT